MKVIYDPEVDTLMIMLSEAEIEESHEDRSGAILDYDAAGNLVGLEIFNASKQVNNPLQLEHVIAGQAA
ncbi:MAG: DUF2283 domain-containing protein [Candidatus Parcubacteria bacterium]|uniref:DUF2283 domain-containing protein n=1 Tax=Phormidesmis priestleyi TaxID=268141 RepID=UPI00083B5BA4|nr:DUF2283 domain-containing protein [Phormidesmis priestleyi]MBC7823093.1 DUF2283 domain-containing protein [Leptolyngbyaceae cyanobacterium LF-bin-113]